MSESTIRNSTSTRSKSSLTKPVAVAAAVEPAVQTNNVGGGGGSGILTQSLAMVDLIFGIYGIELWHYNEATGKLAIISLNEEDDGESGNNNSGSGAFLIKRQPQETDPDNDYATPEALEAYNKLTNVTQSGYIAVNETDPGVGLSGALWAESSGGGSDAGANFNRAWGGIGHSGRESVVWRDVCELADDPDQPYDERLQALAKAGFKLATGITFDINGYRGIFIVYGNPHGDRNKLNNPANARFMNNAAQLIGAAAAIQDPIERVLAFRKEEAFNNWHRLKIKLLTIVRMLGVLRYTNENSGGLSSDRPKLEKKSSIAMLREASARFRGNAKEAAEEVKEAAKNKATRWGKKVRGGSAGIAPAFTWRQCLWTFVGVVTTHTILSRINLLIMTESDKEFNLILAPLGALTTLQYTLTAAPASQPRNAIFAQVFAITVAISLSYIPNIPPWFRSALAPAIVIPGMAKLGIIHPPAGASAIVFSTWKENNWITMGIFLAGVAITIVTAVGQSRVLPNTIMAHVTSSWEERCSSGGGETSPHSSNEVVEWAKHFVNYRSYIVIILI